MEYTLWLLNSFAMDNCQFGSMIKSDDVPIKNCGFPKLREITREYVPWKNNKQGYNGDIPVDTYIIIYIHIYNVYII
jgi:hypothetical protein